MTREEYILQARSKAAKFCALKERSPFEVLEKLNKWELNSEEANQIISFLKDENYLNEERFAKAFCHDKFEFNQWGRIKMRLMIGKHHLSGEVIEAALGAIDKDRYFDTILTLCGRKWEQLHRETNEYQKKQKTVKYLLQKGFEADHCWAAVNRMS